MLETYLRTKRNFVLLGESGCGKSETAIFLARKLVQMTTRKVRLIDMDQTKGMFRSRDWKAKLQQEQIQVYCGEHFMDMPLAPHGMARKLEEADAVNVLDVGGNETGAVVLGQFQDWTNQSDSVVFYIINPYRNFSGNTEDILHFMHRITTLAQVEQLHVISNPNFGHATQAEDIFAGHAKLEEMLQGSGYDIEALLIPDWVDANKFVQMRLPVYSIQPMIQFP